MDRRKALALLARLNWASRQQALLLWAWARGPARHYAAALLESVLVQLGRNMTARRLLSFPHALVLVWVLILVWGERWVFDSKVDDCAWKKWEKWVGGEPGTEGKGGGGCASLLTWSRRQPRGARPHHLILVADPQLIDPHSYPGRPWPLSALTVVVTDNYMRRGFAALQRRLHPDSLFFLGDLFDGGREWKTRQGGFVDPAWGHGRSAQERKWVKTWHRKYGDDYWLGEYQRFHDIFVASWNAGGDAPEPWQRGRKLVTSLPGNHDLGFGAQVQVPVRDRFSAFFGDANRVDVVGNHTIVSVDSVSLSADTSAYKDSHDLQPIYGPVHEFLGQVRAAKRKAALEELRAWHDVGPRPRFPHRVEDASQVDDRGRPKGGECDGPDWPTILLTHVPLYRDPGTPCGPHRERWPPARPPKGQAGPVRPDHGNAIVVAAGYQYQNVLSAEDSARLVESVGNVAHVFSGDDHDYCELAHAEARGGVREITVKSFSMAMGVAKPGFVMVSLYNPVGANGKPTGGVPGTTLQTHLCLLPNQLRTYAKYAALAAVTLAVVAARALLVPVLRLEPFALEPAGARGLGLPMWEAKAKAEPPVAAAGPGRAGPRGASGAEAAAAAAAATGRGARWSSSKRSGRQGGRPWGWAGDEGGPRIRLDSGFYDGAKAWQAGGGRRALGTFGRETWTVAWRVAWMTALFWAYLARSG